MKLTPEQRQDIAVMRYELIKKDRIIDGMKRKIAKMEIHQQVEAEAEHKNKTSTEDKVYAACARLAINIGQGWFREHHEEDIVLILTFAQDQLDKVDVEQKKIDRDFEEVIQSLDRARHKIYRIALALEDDIG